MMMMMMMTMLSSTTMSSTLCRSLHETCLPPTLIRRLTRRQLSTIPQIMMLSLPPDLSLLREIRRRPQTHLSLQTVLHYPQLQMSYRLS
jgi:hypothetical protein